MHFFNIIVRGQLGLLMSLNYHQISANTKEIFKKQTFFLPLTLNVNEVINFQLFSLIKKTPGLLTNRQNKIQCDVFSYLKKKKN